MPKKIKLDLNALSVKSFTTTKLTGGDYTQSASCEDISMFTDCKSCFYTLSPPACPGHTVNCPPATEDCGTGGTTGGGTDPIHTQGHGCGTFKVGCNSGM